MNLDLAKIKKVFFVGIGGIGISAIARMLHAEGKIVEGTDMSDGEVVQELKKLGVTVRIGQDINLISKDTDLVVYTIALEVYDKELLKKIKELSIPVYSYPEMLEVITKDKFTIAVSGTHGKTTTTAMIGHVLKETGHDPSMIVGSLLIGSKSNFVQGSTNLFVVEACEYKRSFLHITPRILVVTNIDEDHLDYYKDISDIQSAFHELALKVTQNGVIIAQKNDPHIQKILRDVTVPILDYDKFLEKRNLKIPGFHNQLDAAATVAVCHYLGISTQDVNKALETFPGTWRRSEYKGALSIGTKVYDDYGHHPKEINMTLKGFRELYPKENNRLIVVFQPHLYSRTKILLDNFSKAFDEADEVFILPIYPAREVDDGTISSEILAERIKSHGKSAKAVTFEDALERLKQVSLSHKDIVITLGAGEAFKIGDELLKNTK